MPLTQLCLATTNSGKLAEFKDYLQEYPLDICMLDETYPDIAEIGSSFIENALIKAKAASEYYQMPVLADDSGICVPALDGAPGVFSARYAGPDRNADDNMNLLLSELKSEENRSARFKTVIALYFKGELITFEGICEGEITKNKTGTEGFGYDPIFQPEGYKKTFAEISLDEKNRIGHRGKAVSKLVTFFKNPLN